MLHGNSFAKQPNVADAQLLWPGLSVSTGDENIVFFSVILLTVMHLWKHFWNLAFIPLLLLFTSACPFGQIAASNHITAVYVVELKSVNGDTQFKLFLFAAAKF